MPTPTHDFYNHSNGYSRSKTALVRSVSGSPEICFFNGFEVRYSFRIGEDYDFKITIFLIGLGNLMICTHDLVVLTKIKETTRYSHHTHSVVKSLLTHVSIDLM
jgi:hypothetical protein